VSLRAIIFDFDGVLANSEPLHYQAFRDVLAGEDVALSEADYYARYLGYDDVGAFRAIGGDWDREWSARRIADMVAKKAHRMEWLESEVSVLFPGAADVVRRAADTVPIAIASGALGAEIRRVLEREGLASCFVAIVAAEDTPASKPSPDPYVHALARLSSHVGTPLRPSECVAIEDSLWGLESARAAGLHTVAVAHTYPAQHLVAEVVIASIADLDLASLQLMTD
jgi:HAD superfamily hydrolase (TIGR01509 family)